MEPIQNPLKLPFSSETAVYVYRAIYRRLRPTGETIMIAAMPKSGSTFLRTALRNATGFRRADLTYAWERGEQDLYLPRMVDNQRHSSVVRHHVRMTAPNAELLKAFHIRPVLLVRNLYDVVVSTRDHLVREGVRNFPSLYATERFYKMDEGEQLDFLIAYALPWYVQFYAGWHEGWRKQELDMLWLRYEDLVEDWAAGVQRVLEYHGIETSPQHIEHAVHSAYGDEKVVLRLNRGVTGQGESRLTESQRRKIRLLLEFFPDVDFSGLGMDSQQPVGETGATALPA